MMKVIAISAATTRSRPALACVRGATSTANGRACAVKVWSRSGGDRIERSIGANPERGYFARRIAIRCVQAGVCGKRGPR